MPMPSRQTYEASGPTLIYEIQNRHPVELLDLTASLMALGEQFKAFVQERGGAVAEEDVRLYVKEIRPGSIIAELVGYAAQHSLLPPEIAFVAQFATELSDIYEYFKGLCNQTLSSVLDRLKHDHLHLGFIKLMGFGSDCFQKPSNGGEDANAVAGSFCFQLDSLCLMPGQGKAI